MAVATAAAFALTVGVTRAFGTLTRTSVAPAPSPALSAPNIDLAITKSATPIPVALSDDITWTMVVTNNGPNDATGVTVGDPLPAGTSFVAASTSQGTCTGGLVVDCDLGSMPAGTSGTITLVTTARVTGKLTNTAMVVGDESETNPADNSATATDDVNGGVRASESHAAEDHILHGGRRGAEATARRSAHGPDLDRRPARSGVRVKIMGKRLASSADSTGKVLEVVIGLRTLSRKQHAWVVRYAGDHESVVFTKSSIKNGMVKVRVHPQKAGIVAVVPLASKSLLEATGRHDRRLHTARPRDERPTRSGVGSIGASRRRPGGRDCTVARRVSDPRLDSRPGRAGTRASRPRCGSTRRACGRCSSGGT